MAILPLIFRVTFQKWHGKVPGLNFAQARLPCGMNRLIPAIALFALCLGGCATLDRKDQSVLQQHRVPPSLYNKMLVRAPLSLPEIIELSHREVPADLVLHYLKSTDMVYHLNSRDVTHLVQAGVSRKVIDYLLNTPLLLVGYSAAPYYPYSPPWYPYAPYYYGSPFPPPFIPGCNRYNRSGQCR